MPASSSTPEEDLHLCYAKANLLPPGPYKFRAFQHLNDGTCVPGYVPSSLIGLYLAGLLGGETVSTVSAVYTEQPSSDPPTFLPADYPPAMPFFTAADFHPSLLAYIPIYNGGATVT